MKKFIIFLIIIAILGGGIWYYFFYLKAEQHDLFALVPEETIYVIETNDLTRGWNALSKGKIWNHLKKTDVFAEYNDMFYSVDSLIRDNAMLETMLKGRQLLICAHMISKNDYDFLYVVNIDNAGKASFMSDVAGLFDYSVARYDYNGNEVITFTDVTTRETFSVCFLGNVLLVSFTGSLVEKAIDQKGRPTPWNGEKFMAISQNLSSSGMFRFYVLNNRLQDYMQVFFSEGGEMTKSFGEATSFLATDIDLSDDCVEFSGLMGIHDSIPSYIRALARIEPGKGRSHRIVSDKAALYLNLTFSNFYKFLDEVKAQYQHGDSTAFADIEKDLEKIEKYLKVSLNDDFFGWIGNEITLVKLAPGANSQEDDVVAFFHAPDMNKAKSGLDHLCKQIKRKTPVKFKEYDYKEFPINMLAIKGFFKLFLGKLFENIEKPYFTFIDDYVVFSNSTGALMQCIDDYTMGNTLSKSASFANISGSCPMNASIFVYLNTPNFYKHLLKSSNKDSRPGVESNKELIMSFCEIGISMIPKNGNFEFKMKWQHDPEIFSNLKILEIERSAEDIEFELYDTLGFMFSIPEVLPVTDGPISLNYDNEYIWAEGSIEASKPYGLWRMYYPSGNLMAILRFENGLLKGNCSFFFDNPDKTEKAIVEYDNNTIKGTYTELYKNGKKKCEIETKNGVPHGDAKFYFENGVEKIKGEFSDSLMNGKWIFYNELGKEILKKKYKEGVEK
jgi:hypothetical protein